MDFYTSVHKLKSGLERFNFKSARLIPTIDFIAVVPILIALSQLILGPSIKSVNIDLSALHVGNVSCDSSHSIRRAQSSTSLLMRLNRKSMCYSLVVNLTPKNSSIWFNNLIGCWLSKDPSGQNIIGYSTSMCNSSFKLQKAHNHLLYSQT